MNIHAKLFHFHVRRGSMLAKYFVLSPRTSLTPVGRYLTVSLWLTVYVQRRETFCVNMLKLVMLFVDFVNDANEECAKLPRQ